MTYPHRKRLPVTRQSITHKVEVSAQDGQMHDIYVTVGLFDDGSPGEVFVTTGKLGSTMRGLLDTVGIQMSLMLQFGVPLKVICDKLAHIKFEPAGATNNKQDALSECSSIVDYIVRWLAYTFEEYLDKGMEEPNG